MLLVANVGNSQVRLGAFAEGDEPVWAQAVGVGSLDALRVPDAVVEALAVGSVNPEAAARLRRWAEAALRCPVLELGAELGVPLLFRGDAPRGIGADRLANALALHGRTGRGGVAVDFGTALNLVVVSPAGEFLGGAIAPGLAMSARALHGGTALLPLVDPTDETPGISCRTRTAIATGLLWGLAGLADRLVERLAEGWPDAPVLATGGDAAAIVPHCRRIHAIIPHLTLEGIRRAYLLRP